MKYLVLFLVVFFVLWLGRSKRADRGSRREASPPVPPDTMLACAQCGLHLPRGEALPGRGGVFCGEAHRVAYEKAHPRA